MFSSAPLSSAPLSSAPLSSAPLSSAPCVASPRVGFNLVSDLHLTEPTDCQGQPSFAARGNSRREWRTIVPDTAKYLIIAGDTCPITSTDLWVPFLDALCTESGYTHIYYVCGNHEFYNSSGLSHHELLAIFIKATRCYTNFTVLHNRYVVLDECVLFGATLWSDVTLAHPNLRVPVYDEHGALVTKNWWNREHYTALAALDSAVLRAQSLKKRLVVATHYAPTFAALDSKHLNSPDRFKYATALDAYHRKDFVYIWMYGHTHTINVDYLTGDKTRIVTNQLPSVGFRRDLIITWRSEKDVIMTDSGEAA